MRVLKRGKTKSQEIWIGKCNVCGSIVEANTTELTNITMGDYRNDNEDFSWETCPVCRSGSERTARCLGVLFYREGSKSAEKYKEMIDE